MYIHIDLQCKPFTCINSFYHNNNLKDYYYISPHFPYGEIEVEKAQRS